MSPLRMSPLTQHLCIQKSLVPMRLVVTARKTVSRKCGYVQMMSPKVNSETAGFYRRLPHWPTNQGERQSICEPRKGPVGTRCMQCWCMSGTVIPGCILCHNSLPSTIGRSHSLPSTMFSLAVTHSFFAGFQFHRGTSPMFGTQRKDLASTC